MDPETYEQHAVSGEGVGDAKNWLKEQDTVSVTLWNGHPISVTPPNHVVLKFTSSEPGVRGDTSSGATKPATLETGAVVKVPLFINEGEIVKVDTRTGEYLNRAGK
jgi:elongation factor P